MIAEKTSTPAEAAPKANATAKKRIFLVEDHPIFRQGLRQMVNSEPDLEVLGEADSAPRAVSKLREMAVDAAVLDISLQGTNGLELIKQIRAEHAALPILVLSMHDEMVYALRALRAGANGYLMKNELPETVLSALRRVLAGEVAVSPSFGEQLIYRVVQSGRVGEPSPIDSLTDRELEILDLVGHGRSSRQIAADLHLSTKTVESHRLHIKDKLGLKSAGELVRFGVEWVNREKGGPT
jgi:DNA-binding NarL/FixJ family response regulator